MIAGTVHAATHVIISVLKFMMDAIKLSLIMICLMALQSFDGSPKSMQMLSKAILTILGGCCSALISTSCCFLIDCTAVCVCVGGGGGGGGGGCVVCVCVWCVCVVIVTNSTLYSPLWASLTAGSTLARSPRTTSLLAVTWTVWILSCSCISCEVTFLFSASCWSLTCVWVRGGGCVGERVVVWVRGCVCVGERVCVCG